MSENCMNHILCAYLTLSLSLLQMASKNGRKNLQEDPSVIPDSQDMQEIRGKDIHSEYNFLSEYNSMFTRVVK